MIGNEGRLDQIFLTVFFEEQVHDIALGMTVFEFNVMLLCKCLGFFIGCYRIKVNPCIFLNAVSHGDPFKRLAKIQFNAVIYKSGCTKHCFCQITEHGLGQLHHSFVIGISLI